MRKSVAVLLATLLALPAGVRGQSAPPSGAHSLTIRLVPGYSFEYLRKPKEAGGLARPGTGTSGGGTRIVFPYTVHGSAVIGGELAYGLTSGLSLLAGGTYRPRVTTAVDCEPASSDGLPVGCVDIGLPDQGELWLVRLGLEWNPVRDLPFWISGAPLRVHQRGVDRGEDTSQWGLGLGIAAEPVGYRNFHLRAGIQDHIVFWKHDTSAPEGPTPAASQLWVFNLGLAYSL